MWIVLRAVSTLPPSTVQLPSASTSPSTHFVCLYTFYSYIFAAIFVQAMSLFYVYTHLRLYSTPTLICGCTAVSTVPDVCRRLYSTSTLICRCTAVSPVPDVWRCLYSTPTLICGRTAVTIVPDVCRRPSSTPTFICGCTTVSTYVFGCLISTFYILYLLLYSSVDAQRSLHTSLVASSLHTFIAAHHLPCFQGGKECMATLHSSDRDFNLLYILYILHLHHKHFRQFLGLQQCNMLRVNTFENIRRLSGPYSWFSQTFVGLHQCNVLWVNIFFGSPLLTLF